MIRNIQMILLGLLVVANSNVYAESVEELETRVKQLERQNAEMKDQHQQLEERMDKLLKEEKLAQELSLDLEERVESFMKISGYADVEYKTSTRENTTPGFRIHHFSLFFTKNIAEKWKMFAEIEYEDGPKFEAEGKETELGGAIFKSFDGKIFLEAMNIDYLWQRPMNFRLGRFFTPAGIWSIDHYPPFVPTQVRPTHIRKIFPQLVDGGLIYGSLKFGESFFKYDIYTGNGEGNSGHGDKNSKKAFGSKIGLFFPVLKHFEFGGSYYQDTHNNDTEKEAFGIHTKLHFWSMILQSEYAVGNYTPAVDPEYDSKGYYAQLMYSIDKFAVGYRYDYYDNDTTVEDSSGEQLTNSLFLNFRVVKDVVIKLEYHDIEKANQLKYKEGIASIAFYLGD